jgi:hypothetical protein
LEYVWGIDYLWGMKDLVYKFLDIHLGDEVVCNTNGTKEWYVIRSKKNGQRILKFFVFNKNGVQQIKLFREVSLCYKVYGYCGIENVDDCVNYIKDWFGDKHGLKKVSDVLKFIPNHGEKILSL